MRPARVEGRDRGLDWPRRGPEHQPEYRQLHHCDHRYDRPDIAGAPVRSTNSYAADGVRPPKTGIESAATMIDLLETGCVWVVALEPDTLGPVGASQSHHLEQLAHLSVARQPVLRVHQRVAVLGREASESFGSGFYPERA